MALKYSRQREIIRRFMCGRTDHPTADTVYMNVRKEIPNISLGTVYRNLMLLASNGELAKVDVGDGTVHFDPVTEDHGHFVCESCLAVSDFHLPFDESFEEAIRTELPGAEVHHRQIIFRGICPSCAPVLPREDPPIWYQE